MISALFLVAALALPPNGTEWKDTAGNRINAHGGGMLRHGDKWWWYGEDRGGDRTQGSGVHVYSSADLTTWKDEGLAFRKHDNAGSLVGIGCVIERPKVVHCAKTGKFVMYFHLELADYGYTAAMTGICTADRPEGPFRFQRALRPNPCQWPQNAPGKDFSQDEIDRLCDNDVFRNDGGDWRDIRDKSPYPYAWHYASGQMSRDMTLYQDVDGKVYHFFASEYNSTMHIAELTDDCLGYTGRWWRMGEKDWTEAPAVFRHGGKYWLVGSGCTGWNPNPAHLYVADRVTGPWRRMENPCRGVSPVTGLGPEKTFGLQSTYAIQLSDGEVVLMFDEWRKTDLQDSRYHWIPVSFASEGQPEIRPAATAEDVVDFADPMVGTAGTGHCSPAAAFPFGMVQPGADTGRAGWNYCAGYYYPDTTLVGFSQTHLNGTGSTDLGDVSIFPFTGERPAKFESRFSHDRETASPGYYAVTLDDFGVRAEVTCSRRVAYYRFTADKSLRLFIDPTSVMNGGANDPQTHVIKSELTAESDRRLTGFVAKKGWIERKLWFVVEANRSLAFKEGVWTGTDKELKVRIAVSASSLEGAKRNLRSDCGIWDFDRVRAEARSAWRGCLERVAIPEGTSETVRRNLATALYRLCLQPNLLSDEGERPFYTTFSLWDTYRAAHPLYCELFPEMVPLFVNSLLEQGRRTGYLPVWALWGQETDWMIGTHSIPVIADAFLRGIPDVDWVAAYAQVRDTLIKRHGRAKVDWGLLDRYGYYPCDIVKGEGVSRLLADTFDCWCAGKMAEKLGAADDAALFFRRANAWTNVYDRATGFMRGRRTDGGWRTPFDPHEVGHNADTDNDFTEGNAWQWTWHVLQDPNGLIAAMGGAAAAEKRLDELFASDPKLTGDACKDDVTGMIGQYVHGNEPSHHIPWLYALCGRPDKAKAIIGEIMKKFYRPTPDGLCGNDDCGQMSAWYVWAFLGRYPVTPCGEDSVR